MKLLLATLIFVVGAHAHADSISIPLVKCQPISESDAGPTPMQTVKSACANGGEIDRQPLTEVRFDNRLLPTLTLTRVIRDVGIHTVDIRFSNVKSAMAIMNAMTSGKIKTLVLNPVISLRTLASGVAPDNSGIGEANLDLDASDLISLNFLMKSEQR